MWSNWRTLPELIEERWQGRFAADEISGLRESLQALASQLDAARRSCSRSSASRAARPAKAIALLREQGHVVTVSGSGTCAGKAVVPSTPPGNAPSGARARQQDGHGRGAGAGGSAGAFKIGRA